MDRRAEILRFVTKEARGIEIAPWCEPLAPKRDGYACLVLDVHDHLTLVNRAKMDPNLGSKAADRIEEVDLRTNAVDIEDAIAARFALGTFDYILSSHNFEHLPNPIRFLRGCEKVLKPGGILSMAIPDHRACFDHFRPRTLLTDWLEAYFENRRCPSPAQIFTQTAYHSYINHHGGEVTAFSLGDNPLDIVPYRTLAEAFEAWKIARKTNNELYQDTHCSAMTPASFELLVTECKYLRLLHFDVRQISELHGCEFYVHLENRLGLPTDAEATRLFYATRESLLQEVTNEAAVASPFGWKAHQKIAEIEAEIEAMRRSSSWRLTAPLRKLVTYWRAVLAA
jgi:SAM-dependent methyltransferase